MQNSGKILYFPARDPKPRTPTRNRVSASRSHYPRLSSSDHKLYESGRRSPSSHDKDTYHRREESRKRETEERKERLVESERKRDKEGPETQTREIQRILTMVDDPKEQVSQFLELINRKSASKASMKVCYLYVYCVLQRNFIVGDKCPMCSKYCGTLPKK